MKQLLVGLAACAMVGLAGSRPLAQAGATPPAGQTPAVAAASAPAAAAPVPGHSEIIQRILVRVNGEIFTERDLEQKQIDALQKMNKQVTAEDLQSDASLRALLIKITPGILTDAIDDLIVIQRAHELGFKVTEAQYKDAIDGIKKENKFDDAQLDAALKTEGMTMDQLRTQIEHLALLQMVQAQEIMSKVAMTEEEARQYYDKHPDEFLSAPSITLREVLVTVAAAPSSSGGLTFAGANDTSARAKIDDARARVLKGEDFAKVAEEVSDAQSKARGGLLTPVKLDDLSQAVRDATDKLKAGQISEVIKTSRGYTFFKIEARTAQSVLPFDQVHESIMTKVYDQRKDVETRKYLERLRGQALIEWKDQDLKKLYESQAVAK